LLMGNNVGSRIENAKKTGSLQLSGQKMRKIPENVELFPKLRVVDFSNNSLTNLGPWIGRLVNLKVLNVSGNKLEHLPGDLSHLNKLEILNASHNRMTTFLNSPNSINLSSLRHLRTVDLSNNQLTEFPLELCFSDIPLDILDLSKNKISLIPDAISPLQVIELNLCENEISVISESLSKCPRLKVLRLAHNKIQLGEFPLALLESSNISLLTIEGNPLSLKILQELPAYAKVRSQSLAFI
uniref:LRRCT domain-containing protein n=1 Tax=Hymenolepis diminuta TaxID=6216 RepID=A0A0R3SZK9_HYMDI